MFGKENSMGTLGLAGEMAEARYVWQGKWQRKLGLAGEMAEVS